MVYTACTQYVVIFQIWEAKEDVRKAIVCGSMEDYMRESSMGYSINFDGETVTNKLFVKFFSDWDQNFEAGFYMTFYEVEGKFFFVCECVCVQCDGPWFRILSNRSRL